MEQYYAVLGVSPLATDAEIEEAYYQKILDCHPENNPDVAYADLMIRRIEEAYDMIRSYRRVRTAAEAAPQEDETVKDGKQPSDMMPEQPKKSRKRPGCIAAIIIFVLLLAAAAGAGIYLNKDYQANKPNFVRGSSIYYFVSQDLSWQEAQAACTAKGGHLVIFETEDEYQAVCAAVQDQQSDTKMFYIGGKRKDGYDSYASKKKHEDKIQAYAWVDGAGNEQEIAFDSWAYWKFNNKWVQEPSFTKNNTKAPYMAMFVNDGKWEWQDVPDAVLGTEPEYKGSLGYIIEIDNADKMGSLEKLSYEYLVNKQ